MNERLIAPSGSVPFKVFPIGQKQVPGRQIIGINAYEGTMENVLFALSDLLRARDSQLT